MINPSILIIGIALVTALACALPGVFLVLRGVALMSDAISHAILLGIVLMFLVVQNLDSPLLFIGASLAGLFTVVCTEQLMKFKYIKKDAAIGLVFPLFFSIAVILINFFIRNVHLDTDMVLLGELAFSPFNRLIIAQVDVGPQALWVMTILLALNTLLVILFYKELTLALFDRDFSTTINKSPRLIYYGLMLMTSVTAVGAFDVVGSLVVVALIIVPAATASLLAYRLIDMIMISLLVAICGAVGGYGFSIIIDASIAGSIAVLLGIFFLLALFSAPGKGIFSRLLHERTVYKQLEIAVVVSYLMDQGKACFTEDIATQLGWNLEHTNTVCLRAMAQNLISYSGGSWIASSNRQ